MKKALKTLICSSLLVVMIMSMAACGGNNDLQEKYNDLQARLEQQEEKLGQQDEKLKQQEEKIKELQKKDKELESKNKKLEEKNRELEKSVNELTNAIPHEVGVFGYSGFSIPWESLCGEAMLLRSKSELTSYLTVINDQYRKELNDKPFPDDYPEKWSMRYKNGRFDYDGTSFDEDTISEWYDESYFNSNALIFCFFYSPNMSARLEGHRVCIDNSTIQVKIEFSYGTATAVEFVMVVLEVKQSDVRNIIDARLETTKREYIER